MVELHQRLSKAQQIIRALEDELREADRGLIALTTELEARAAALEESEARFRLMVEGSEEVFFYSHDEEGRFTYLSPSVERVLGYPSEELLGEPYHVLLTKDAENSAVDERTQSALGRGEGSAAYTAIVRHRNGHDVCLELVEQPLVGADRAAGMHGFARDVTDRKRREEALRETTRLMNALIEASPAAIYALDRDGRVDLWNPAAERLFGWSAVEVLGEKLPSAEDTSELERLMRRSLEGQAFSALDVRRVRKDQTVIDINVSTAPLYTSSDDIDGVVVVVVDVSEKKGLQEQLLRAQKMEAIGRLAGGVAHDFNNILTAIQGHAEFALDQLERGSTVREEVEEVHRSAKRAADLTRQLLAFSRQQVVQPKVLDLAEEVADTQKMLRRIIGEDVELETRLEHGRVKIDPSQLHQVILNLVVNARDAMPEGGRVTMEVRPTTVERPGAATASVEPGDFMVLSIRDTGHGMDETTKQHLFEPFFTTKDLGKGTGLGLATVYGIVTSAGGEVRVTSDPGEGTSFAIYLPRVDEEPETQEQPVGVPVDDAVPVSGTVLVVEDEGSVRSLVRRILERKGYEVIELAEPEEALALTGDQLERVDLVLSDVVMPGMSGLELADALLALRSDLRIIFMSGYAQEEVARRDVPIDDALFIEKPFSPAELARTVEEALRR